MGASSGPFTPGSIEKARELGRYIARQGCCLLTGACPGLPHEVVLGAKEQGGHIIGISPAKDLEEHVNAFSSPYEEYDVMIYAGLGLMGRELINIYSSHVVICVGGRSGTLGEFAIAYEEGKIIGLLTGCGGIADAISPIIPEIDKQGGAQVIADPDPLTLLNQLIGAFNTLARSSPLLSCFVKTPA